jgi:hypothetical protein
LDGEPDRSPNKIHYEWLLLDHHIDHGRISVHYLERVAYAHEKGAAVLVAVLMGMFCLLS